MCVCHPGHELLFIGRENCISVPHVKWNYYKIVISSRPGAEVVIEADRQRN